MIPLLPKWHLMPNRPSYYDTDSKTLLELASTLHASMNNVIEEYNKLEDSVNNTITEFTQSATQNQETFKVAIRQEFQDFIDTVDIKLSEMRNDLDAVDIKLSEIKLSYDEATESLNMNVSGGV